MIPKLVLLVIQVMQAYFLPKGLYTFAATVLARNSRTALILNLN